MNKKELLEHINKLIAETKMDEAGTNNTTEQMYYLGKENGLLWAKVLIQELKCIV